MTEEAARIQQGFGHLGISGALFSDPDNVCYVSGVVLGTRLWAGPCFAGGTPILVLGSRELTPTLVVANTEALRETTPGTVQIARYTAFDLDGPHDAEADYQETLIENCRGLGEGGHLRIGVDRMVSHAAVSALCRQFPHLEPVDVSDLVRTARRHKTAAEVARLRRACAINDVGQEALRTHARPGISEIDLWRTVIAAMEAVAGSELRVTGELVSGPRTGVVDYPGGPTGRRLAAGDTVIMDLSVQVDGYWSDTTNTLCVGTGPDPEQLLCYRAAHDAFTTGLEWLHPGIPCAQVEHEVRHTLNQFGFDPPHYLGHQLGASVNEPPRLVGHDPDTVEAGMVFALEPGAYQGAAGTTGARLEKNILITPDGPEVLSQFTWGLPV